MSTAISSRHRTKPDRKTEKNNSSANEFNFVSSILSQKKSSSNKSSSFNSKMAKSSSSGASSNQSNSSSKKNKFGGGGGAGANIRAPSAANAVMEDARPYTKDNMYNKIAAHQIAASSSRRMGGNNSSSSVMNQSFTSTSSSRPQSNNLVTEVVNTFPEMTNISGGGSRTYLEHNPRDSSSEIAQQRSVEANGYRDSRGNSTGSSPLDRSMNSKPERDSPVRKETKEPRIFQILSQIIRKQVSKKKNRHTFEQDRMADTSNSFDLTYVEERIIAMGYPSKGFEGIYRNALDQVEYELNKKHGVHYKVYNLCAEAGRKDGYEDHRFNGNVCNDFGFYDHNPPTFEIIQGFCDDAYDYLCANDKNTIVVHCKAGKGRTGTMISSLFIHISLQHEKFRKEQEASSSPNEIMTDSTNSKNSLSLTSHEKPARKQTPIIPEFPRILMAEYAMEYYGSVRTSNGKGVTIRHGILRFSANF